MARDAASDVLRELARAEFLPHRFRPPLLRLSGVRVGDGTLLMSGIRFARGAKIKIGAGCFINFDCYFDAEASISIGDNTSIGDHVRFITSTHDIGPNRKRAGRSHGVPVVVGSGVWIGSGVTILPGVVVGDGCVIAAGSVVTSDCLPDAVYAGVPAKQKRFLD
jgi:maltose O-acetyltransferase